MFHILSFLRWSSELPSLYLMALCAYFMDVGRVWGEIARRNEIFSEEEFVIESERSKRLKAFPTNRRS